MSFKLDFLIARFERKSNICDIFLGRNGEQGMVGTPKGYGAKVEVGGGISRWNCGTFGTSWARLAEEIVRLKQELPCDAFDEMPFAGAAGYHSKTIAYSLYHIFRIEDIVLHSVMQDSVQIFSRKIINGE